MGAKNHGVIMPDANKEYVVNQVPLPLSPHHASCSRCSFFSFPVGWGCIWGSRAEMYGLDNSCHGLDSFFVLSCPKQLNK